MVLLYIRDLGKNEVYINKENLRLIVKRIYPIDSEELLKRIQDLSDNHLPKIYRIEVLGDKIVTYAEYIHGVTLQELIDTGKFIDSYQLHNYSLQIIECLSNLHSKNIIHKDIKPSNIIIDNDKLYLIDFDISRIYEQSKEKDTKLFGTSGYASPEQYGFSQTTVKSDIYSLGKTFLEMLTITSIEANSYEELEQLFKQMIDLNPEKRISLMKVKSRLNEILLPNEKIVKQEMIKKSRIFWPLTYYMTSLPISILITLLYFYTTYDYIDDYIVNASRFAEPFNLPVYVLSFYFGIIIFNYLVRYGTSKITKNRSRNILIIFFLWYIRIVCEVVTIVVITSLIYELFAALVS